MSVSIQDDPADDRDGSEEGARRVLAGWLDDFAAGRCERSDMEEAFLSICGRNDEASWDALALLDQYQRLKKVDVELARDLKSKIAQLAVGAPKQPSRKPNPADSASSGTRWRQQPQPEQEAESGHTDDIDESATRVRTPPAAAKPPAPRITRIQTTRVQDRSEELEEDDEDEEIEDADEIDVPPASPPATSFRALRTPPERAGTEFRRVPGTRQEPAVAPAAPAERPALQKAQREPHPSAPAAAASDVLTKRVLRERYELLSVLARGASSTVYKALDRHRANLAESARYVAIKVLNTNYDNRAQALAELESEFHQAQSLSHPNIGSVFDLDKDSGTYFVVMELLEGDLLANVLRKLDSRPMARQYALGLINSIGSALAYAHRREIAHGDLKPRNIMITSDGEVRVLEFGFARARSLQSGEIDGAHDGVAIGTPAYASSERVHGFEPDPSDDVYSLACIAYELLSGRHPYGGRSALLARAHGKKAQRVPGLTHRQWHALQRALAWDRADRKIDVADLMVALGTTEAKSEAVPPELLSIPDDTSGRRRRMFGMIAAFAIAVALVFYFVTRIPPPLQSIDASTALPPAAQTETEVITSEPVAPAQPTTGQGSAQSAPRASSAPTEEVTAPAAARASSSGTTSSSTTPTPGAAPSNPLAARSGSIQFEKDTFVVTESDGSVSLQVRRSGSTRGVLSFRWTLRSNSAEGGADYAGIGPGLEQIPSGVSTATVTIPLVSDAIVENTELFLVELEVLDEGVSIGELGHAAVIIVDDD
jgi:serine/threonine protein kinase